MLLGLAVTWLLVVILVLWMAWQLGNTMVKATNMAHLRYESTLVADEVSEQIEVRFDALSRLNERIEVDASNAAIRSTLERNEALMAWFEGVVVANEEGQVVADWPVVEGREGLDTAQREYFKMLRGGRRPYVSEPFVGRASGMPMVLVSVPRIDDRGEFNGFVGGVVSLDSGGLFDRLARVRLGEEGFVGIATASGKILYHPNQNLIMTDVPDSDFNPWLNLALDGWEGESIGSLLNGEQGFQSYSQVWSANWVIGLYLPSEQALAPLSGFLQRLWWLGIALTLLMLPVLWLILRRMLSPLKHLAKQIGQVGRGERARVELGTRMQELQHVAGTFNRVEDERQVLMTNLQEREAFLDSVLNATPQGMFVANFDGDITYMNPALLDMLDIQPNTPMEAWLHKIHADDRGGAKDMWQHSLKSGSDFVRQLRFIRNEKETLWLDIHARVVMLSQGGHSLGLVGVVKDITERREQEAIQRWEAEHDPLTGLLNRRGFERRLDDAFAEFQKTSNPSALLLFDLDRFKPINDEGGHALGDEMLRRIAQVVAWEVRRSDHVARQGGDEFGVLLPSCTLSQAQKIAESLCQAVGDISVVHEGNEYGVTLSIGVTTFHEDDGSTEDAMARADAGSYAAKNKGRNGVVVNLYEEHDTDSVQ
ncbi:sensor domain-containing diguanylate cyclase [Halomonas sp. SH5A2]|uniref:sensor domain-containing diguanylate cyclase n=1 Tax=Halomonas sp. SH5A2 TaxID=2749040 RepID=UPI001F0ADAF8|nr:diguanylate cyclase [Halomonas sp. SH5A2]